MGLFYLHTKIHLHTTAAISVSPTCRSGGFVEVKLLNTSVKVVEVGTLGEARGQDHKGEVQPPPPPKNPALVRPLVNASRRYTNR